MSEYQLLQEALATLGERTDVVPRLGLVLGSGLGAFAEGITGATAIPFSDIPHLPRSTVPGHAGTLMVGNVAGVPCAVMSGRVHCYEGHSAARVSYGVRLLGLWGAETIVLTNAAGGINPSYQPGDLMVIRDHINLLGDNPLRGPNEDELGPRFPDITRTYTPELRSLALELAGEVGLTCHEGVYCAMAGPSYESPAEIEMLRRLGGDAVGMSTVPEAIAAIHMGKQVLAISCITNLAAGVIDQPLSHDEVKEVAERVRVPFVELLGKIVARL